MYFRARKRITLDTSVRVRLLYPVVTLIIGIFIVGCGRSVQTTVDETLPRFSAERAFDTTREYITQFPKRYFGSIESRRSTVFLTNKLTAMGYDIEYIHFGGRIGGKQQVGRNVLAYKHGETDEIVAITAHYDTVNTTVQGAVKNGAAVGVLMELAWLFSEENTHRSLLFVFTDGGEWGATGANDLMFYYEKKDRIAVALTLDYVAPGDLAGFRLGTIGQLNGMTPSELKNLVGSVVRGQTPPVPVRSERLGLLERAFMISVSEQGPFLKMGVPAINLGSFSTDEASERSILRTHGGRIENLKTETIGVYGRVAEQIVRSLAKSSEIPRFSDSDSTALRTIKRLCTLVGFLIFLIITFFHTRDFRKGLAVAQMCREVAAFFATWLPFLVLFSGIKLAAAARLFPLYDLYPAVAHDPLMQNPPWRVLISIAVGVVFASAAAWITARYFLREWTKPDYNNSCVALWCVLSVTLLLAVCYNPAWALVFFSAPAVLWQIRQGGECVKSDPGRRFSDAALIAAAAIPTCLALWWLAAKLGFGWNFFWYQTLALTTGLFSPFAYFMATAVVAAGIRFIVVIFFHRR